MQLAFEFREQGPTRTEPGPAHPKMVACHIDGDKLNNHAWNLRWDSPKANSLDAVRHRKAKAVV